MEKIKKRIATVGIFHNKKECQIMMVGAEEIIKTKEVIMMENWAHTAKYAR